MKNTRKNLKEAAEVKVSGVDASMKRNDLIKLMSSFLGELGQAGVQAGELISAWKAWSDSDIQKFIKAAPTTSKPSTSMSLSELRSIIREEILKEMEVSPKQGSVTSLQKNLRTIGNKPMSGVSSGEAANAEQLISSILDQIQTSKQDMTTVLKLLTQKLNQLTSQK